MSSSATANPIAASLGSSIRRKRLESGATPAVSQTPSPLQGRGSGSGARARIPPLPFRGEGRGAGRELAFPLSPSGERVGERGASSGQRLDPLAVQPAIV